MNDTDKPESRGPYWEEEDPAPDPPRRRSGSMTGTLLSWGVILALVTLAMFAQGRRQQAREDEQSDKLGTIIMRIQGRLLVGSRALFADMPRNEANDPLAEAHALNTGSLDQRLRYVVLVGELAGATEALQQLNLLREKLRDQRIEPPAEQAAVLDILDRLYQEYELRDLAAPSVSALERQRLREQLDWFGDLALAPAQQEAAIPPGNDAAESRETILAAARRTAVTLLGFLGLGVMLAFVGLIGLILFGIVLCMGKVGGGLECGSQHHGVYAETFALWLVLFSGFGLGAAYLPVEAPSLLLSGAAMLLSLIALAWPVVRGLPWRVVRHEIGWCAGRQPAMEPSIGLGCYVMTLPLLALGVIVTFLLLLLQKELAGGGPDVDGFAPNHGPAHPVVVDIAFGAWRDRVLIFLLACVVAPLVEETMFRGVLYRHLRELSAGLGTIFSVLLSATLVSFLFAAVHPQGVVAIPALMALAFGFTLAREWRGTLVPAMVAHGVNNGLVMLLFLLVLGD
jgi:membrane protease YdiL (CAAX protease family)